MRNEDDLILQGRTVATVTTPQGFVSACRRVLRRDLPQLLEDVFARVDDALYDLADKSSNNRSYTIYFDAMRSLRRRRGEIAVRFLENVEVDIAPAAASGDRGALELMPQSELEESLAVSNLISKAESRYRQELAELRGHLAALSGRGAIDPRADPIGPHAICNAFRAALQPVDDLDLSIKLVVYKLFDRQVMDHLGEIYADCLQCGGVPQGAAAAPQPILRRPASGGGRTAEDAHPARPSAPASAWRGPQPREPAAEPVLFDGLRRLLARRTRPRPEQAVTVEHGELMAVLGRMQALELPAERPAEASAALREHLRQELALRQGGPPVLMARDEDTLDLVFMLFEGILKGSDLPDAIKALISRLQIPILKLALADSGFFDDPGHPARSLLNHLAEAAAGWTDNLDGVASDLYRRIEETVERVIRDFDHDPDVFRRLDAELLTWIERERRQAEERASRALAGLAGRERDRSGRQLVEAALDDRMGRHGRVPEAVAALLHEGWSEVLLAALLRSGSDGEDWQRAMATVDRLLWSVQPKFEYEERRELLRTIPDLLRTLREALAAVSYDQRRLARSFKELQALHIVALRGASAAGRAPGEPAGGLVRGFPPGLPAAAGVPAQAPPELAVGCWLEIEQDGGTRLRVRLAGRSAAGVHLFVDRQGHRALELDGAALAALMAGGRARIIRNTGGGLVDRAIEAMLHSLGGS